jgi:DNA repair exonuclease SbcCD ATPase subunit
MSRVNKIKEEIKKVFKKEQAKVLIAIVDIVDETVKAKDFNELKEIVRQIGVKLSELIQAQKETDQKIKELTEAQKRTDQKVAELAEAQKKTEQKVAELIEAQKRTEQRVEELAQVQKETEQKIKELTEAQKRTEQRVEELAQAQKKTEEEVRELTHQVRALTEEMREIKMELRDVRRELGGLGKSFSYSLENEAFRMLPKFLKEKYSIEIEEKFIRKEIGGKEINIFGFGKKDGKSIIVIGEARSRIDTKEKIEEVLQDVEEKEKVVAEEYKGFDIVKIVITHFASNLSLELAKQRGVIIIQSFEW